MYLKDEGKLLRWSECLMAWVVVGEYQKEYSESEMIDNHKQEIGN